MKVTNLQVAQIVEDAVGCLRRYAPGDNVGNSDYSCDALSDALCQSIGVKGVQKHDRHNVKAALIRNKVKNVILNQATTEALGYSASAFDEFEQGYERQEARALWLTFVAEGFENGTFSVDEINNILREHNDAVEGY